MADSQKNKGQVIQTARGSILSRLQVKPLAKGELFIHTSDDLKSKQINGYKIHDLVTNTDLKTIFKGDMFAGDNSSHDVYYIGSGGALKWGGIINNNIDIDNQLKSYPNYIFLYNGPTFLTPSNAEDEAYQQRKSLYSDEELSDDKQNVLGQDQPANVWKPYVAENSLEWDNHVNPGDLIFYSATLDQIVILPQNRSSDALTKINVSRLISNSMRNLLKESNVTKPSTLKEFLDRPARHYQYLAEAQGWNPVKVEEDEKADSEPETGEKRYSVKEIDLEEGDDGDGYIHFIPFTNGRHTYKPKATGQLKDLVNKNATESDDAGWLYEGDLIISLPGAAENSEDGEGGVHHVVVSLYGLMLDQLKYDKGIERADDYATSIWAVKATGNGYDDETLLDGDIKFVEEHDQLKDFIERLFLTKVDVDPTTKKIISSQLPDYLLGAPKYMGHLSKTLAEWEKIDSGIKAEEFIKQVIAGRDWENLDSSEDDTSGYDSGDSGDHNPNNEKLSQKVNDALKSGSYWIYQGDTIDISRFTELFCIDAAADDFDNYGDLENQLKNLQKQLAKLNGDSGYDSDSDEAVAEDEEVKDSSSSGDSDSDSGEEDTEKTKAKLEAQIKALQDQLNNPNAQHLLCKGDWLIYNGENKKFEIIDNTSSFIGILVDGVKVAGVVNILHPDRKQETLSDRWVNGKKEAHNAIGRETDITATADSMTFKNPDAVLFQSKNGGNLKALTSKDYLPIITDKGYAYSSRFKLIEDQTGFQVNWDNANPTDENKIQSVQFTTHVPDSWARHLEATKYEWTNNFWKDWVRETDNNDVDNSKVTTQRVFEKETKDGFNFEWLHFMGYKDDSTTTSESTIYQFEIASQSNPRLTLPQHSGTLATERYVNYGFTVVKAIINDMYDKIVDMSTKGHIDWLQTIRESQEIDPHTGKKRKEVYDSYVKQEFKENESLKLDIFYSKKPDEKDFYKENTDGTYAQLSVYSDLNTKEDSPATKYGAPVDVNIGSKDSESSEEYKLNPSTRAEGEAVENVLPNHSGILLNNNSVIDGGEWT